MPQDILPTDENLSERQLKWGNWWLEHKHHVKIATSIVLGVIAFVLVSYGSWGFLDWYFGSGVRERGQIALLTKNLTDYTAFRQAEAPQDVQIEPVVVVSSGDKKYDLISRITNPNDKWWATFDYRFSGSGLDGAAHHGYILPNGQKYLRLLAVSSDAKPSPTVQMTSLTWHRVDQHVVRPDYRTWAGERLNIKISDASFVPPSPNDPLPVNKAKFVVTNETAFGYHSMTFFIRLLSGSRIVGVNQIVASELKAGERRDMEASWFNDLPNVTRVEITPEVDIFDPSVYLKPQG